MRLPVFAHQQPAPDLPPAPLPPLQLPLLDKAAHRLLHGEGFEGLRAEMTAFREENNWVEQSALFRWACCARCACCRCRQKLQGGSQPGAAACSPAPTCPHLPYLPPPALPAPTCLALALLLLWPCPCPLCCSALTELPELVGEAWWDWPAGYRDRDPETLAK